VKEAFKSEAMLAGYVAVYDETLATLGSSGSAFDVAVGSQPASRDLGRES
jgi:hypothetical protein